MNGKGNQRTPANRRVPVVLTIAGSDNSGGAGIQADLKTITTCGAYGAVAITCVVAEHPGRVHSIEPVTEKMVRAQVDLVFESLPVAAIKTGMLFSRGIIRTVVKSLLEHAPNIPLVVDPVMVASSGTPLLQPDAIRAIREELIPTATLVTPNRDEAALLWGAPITTLAELRQAAIDLSRTFGVPFLVKGGHLQLSHATDILAIKGRLTEYRVRTVPGANPHGTGCTFSAAIATGLAHRLSLPAAVQGGKRFITRAIRQRLRLGPYDLLNHLPAHPFKIAS